MMQPPFQMRAHSPRSMRQPSARPASRMRFMPCAYEQILAAYSAARTSAMSCALSTLGSSVGPTSTLAAAARSSLMPDRKRASSAAAMVGAATQRSAASWIVHRPVPFMPVLSRMASMASPDPPTASLTEKMRAVISIRNESSSPAFHVANTCASSAFVSPPTFFSKSYDSACARAQGGSGGRRGGGRCNGHRSARACAWRARAQTHNQLHVAVLDAVVDHLDVVAAAQLANVRHARARVGLGRTQTEEKGKGRVGGGAIITHPSLRPPRRLALARPLLSPPSLTLAAMSSRTSLTMS